MTTGQRSRSQDEKIFLAVDTVDWLKCEGEVGKISYGAVLKNAGGDETVMKSRPAFETVNKYQLVGCLSSFL